MHFCCCCCFTNISRIVIYIYLFETTFWVWIRLISLEQLYNVPVDESGKWNKIIIKLMFSEKSIFFISETLTLHKFSKDLTDPRTSAAFREDNPSAANVVLYYSNISKHKLQWCVLVPFGPPLTRTPHHQIPRKKKKHQNRGRIFPFFWLRVQRPLEECRKYALWKLENLCIVNKFK